MTEATVPALIERLRVIEDQPLPERATAYVQLHDELTRALEADEAPGPAAGQR